MTHTKTVTVGKTSNEKKTGSQAAERARIVKAAADQRARSAQKGLTTGQVSRGGRVIRPVGGAPAQTPKPPPPVAVVKPSAKVVIDPYKATAPAKAQLIVSRSDGSRVITGSNVVNQGDRLGVNILGAASKGETLRVVYGKNETSMTTDKFGNGHTTITMNEAGNIGVNVLVPSGRVTARGATVYDTFVVTVWVQAKAAPAPMQQEVQVSQTVTPAAAQQVVTPAGPSFIDQLGQAGEQAKVGFGGFGIGVLAAGILGVILLFRKPGLR